MIYQLFLPCIESIQHHSWLCTKIENEQRAIDFGELEMGKKMQILAKEVTICSI
jgi:hypothetical protein